MSYPSASLTKNDKKANVVIISVSLIVFLAVIVLHELKLKINVNFDPHIFAKLNAYINGTVSILLVLGLLFVKSKKYLLHKRVMNLSILLSVLFLLSYIAHHLLAESTEFGGEGSIKTVYYFILIILYLKRLLQFLFHSIITLLRYKYHFLSCNLSFIDR